VTLFKKGDIVVLKSQPGNSSTDKWAGLRAEVVMPYSESAYLKPLVTRPDGSGFSEFYWDNDSLTLEAPVSPATILNIDIQERMYVNYIAYFVKKGSDKEELMGFRDWQKHLGLSND
jgi:hypothetical protein